jgi:hypothetical protein
MKLHFISLFFTLSAALAAQLQQPVPSNNSSEEDVDIALERVIIRLLRNPQALFLPDSRTNLEFSGGVLVNSNAVTSAFSNAFINPIFIDESLKETTYRRLETNNRFGLELEYGASLSFFPDSSWRANKHAIRVQYKQGEVFAAAFTNDVFRLFFGGNAAFADKTAALGPSAFYNLRSRSIYIDYLKVAKGMSFSFGLAVVQGNNLIDTRINEGSLYTSSDGSFLDLQWKGKAMLSNSNGVGESKSLSPGFATRVSIGRMFGRTKRWHLQLKAEDVGFINWNSGTTLINADTSVRFTGLQFNDLFNTEWGTVRPADSLRRIFTGRTISGNEMAALPWLVNTTLSYSGGNNANYMFLLDARYRKLPGMKPLLTAQFHKNLFEHLSTRLTGNIGFTVGGFGKLNSQLGLNWWGNQQNIRVDFIAMEGLMAPQKLSGTGIMLNYCLKL